MVDAVLSLVLAGITATAGARDELESVVDTLDPAKRRAAALALAARDVPIEEWLARMTAFGSFDPVATGVIHETVPLWTSDGVELTELFVYVPSAYDPKTPAPLMVQTHGTGGSGRGQWIACARPGQDRSFWVQVTQTGDAVEENFRPTISQFKLERLDDEGIRRFMLEEAEKRAPRLEVERKSPGVFHAKSKEVQSFRLLLRPQDLEAGKPLRVRFNRRLKRLDVKPDKAVLLAEFAERFDRTFLPVAEVNVHR